MPINGSILSILKERAKVRVIKKHLVFYNAEGNKIDGDSLRRAFVSACKHADISGLRFHDLRHTFATRLVLGGADLYTAQKLGRWKTVQMVARYAHHHSESLRAGVDILDKEKENFITNLSQCDGTKERPSG